ncbi:MAG: 4Fe-4S binding protein [Holosporales bacterium]|nr:4Fe-4S binding protein [Holosporales bacterium]
MCEGICPCNGAISIKAPGRCVFNPARCSFCRLCQRACPTEAISFVRSFTKANPRMKRSISKT